MDSTFTSALFDTPEFAAVAVLVLGLVIARLASNGVAKLASKLDRWLTRYSTGETYIGSARWIGIAKGSVFWITIFVAVLIALRLLGNGDFSRSLDGVIAFVPNFVVGLVIIAAGHLLGVIAVSLMSRADITPTGTLGPRLVYAGILSVAAVMGIQQMGVDTTFLTQLALVLIIVVLGGLTLAFALGARQHVANLVASSEVQRYAVGDQIRVADAEGTIVNIRATGMDLRTAAGMLSIPSSQFARVRVLTLARDPSDE